MMRSKTGEQIMSATLIRGLNIILTGTMLSSMAFAAGPTRVARQKLSDEPGRPKVVIESLVPKITEELHDEAMARRASATRAPRFKSRYRKVVPSITNLPELTQRKPALMIILKDESYSMEKNIDGSDISKMSAAKQTVNEAIADMIDRNRIDDTAKNRVDVAGIGYSTGLKTKGGQQVESDITRNLFSPILNKGVTDKAQRRNVATLSELLANPRRVKDDKMQWVGAHADGKTPMRRAINKGRRVYEQWAEGREAGNLVLALNVTDGESTDGNPAGQVRKFANVVRQRGDKLLMTNIHLSASGTMAEAVIFPTDEDADKFDAAGKAMFEQSSLVPSEIAQKLIMKGIDVKPGARMMAYNATVEGFASVFAAGSSVAVQ
jgi:hypothetical protein